MRVFYYFICLITYFILFASNKKDNLLINLFNFMLVNKLSFYMHIYIKIYI